MTGCCAASDADIRAAPSGSTPIDPNAAAHALHRRAHAGDQSAAAHRHEDRRRLRTLLENLQADRPGAGDDPRMIERRHHRQAARRGDVLRPRLAIGDVVPAKITSAPKRRTPSTLTRGAVSGMTTTAGMPKRCGDQRDRLAMVAGRIGDDAGGARLWRQLRQHVARAADLERADRLQVFAFERERASKAGLKPPQRSIGISRTASAARHRECAAWPRPDVVERTSIVMRSPV